MYDEDVCLVDSVTTLTLFQDKKYLLNLKLAKDIVNIILDNANLIENCRRTNVILPGGTNIMSKMYCIIIDPKEICLI